MWCGSIYKSGGEVDIEDRNEEYHVDEETCGKDEPGPHFSTFNFFFSNEFRFINDWYPFDCAPLFYAVFLKAKIAISQSNSTFLALLTDFLNIEIDKVIFENFCSLRFPFESHFFSPPNLIHPT